MLKVIDLLMFEVHRFHHFKGAPVPLKEIIATLDYERVDVTLFEKEDENSLAVCKIKEFRDMAELAKVKVKGKNKNQKVQYTFGQGCGKNYISHTMGSLLNQMKPDLVDSKTLLLASFEKNTFTVDVLIVIKDGLDISADYADNAVNEILFSVRPKQGLSGEEQADIKKIEGTLQMFKKEVCEEKDGMYKLLFPHALQPTPVFWSHYTERVLVK